MNDYLVTGLIILFGLGVYFGLLMLIGRFCSMNDIGDDINYAHGKTHRVCDSWSTSSEAENESRTTEEV